MSAVTPRCDRCDLDRVFARVAPLANQATYGVDWRCPGCDSHILELCPLGPLVPTDQTCLNCAAAIDGGDNHARCPDCGMTRGQTAEFFGLDSPPADPIETAGKLFDQGLVRRAVATLNFALWLDPSLEAAWQTKYAFLSGLGFTEAACTVIEAAIDHVVNPDLLISYAHILQTLDRHAEAVEVYREYLVTAPDGEYAGVALCNMADCTHALKDSVSAEVLYRRAIEKEPGRATHYSHYARMLLAEKRFDAALALIEQALPLATEPAVAVRLLEDQALAYVEQRRGLASLKSADTAIERGASGVRAYYLRGRALAMLGRLTEARECIGRVLQLDPKNADALRARKMLDKALQ